MCWRSQAGTGDRHRLCGEHCSSGQAAGDKSGAEVEQEEGHANQSKICLKPDSNSNKCPICDTCPWQQVKETPT